jgi:hypothetical protein
VLQSATSQARLKGVTRRGSRDRYGPSVPCLSTPTEQKEAVKQETVAELMVGILTKHELLAIKKDVVTTEADFEDRSLVPYFYGNPQGKHCIHGLQ